MNDSVILLLLCLCGCGKNVTRIENKYISGHNKPSTDPIIRQFISDSLQGKSSWNKGKVMSEESKLKLSESLKGRTAWNKGKKLGPSWNSGLTGVQTGWNKGKPMSGEAKKKLSNSHKGQISGMFGKHHSEETKQRLRIASTGHIHSEIQKKKIGDIHRGKIVSEETKRKMRISIFKRMDIQNNNNEPVVPCIGKEERKCLDELEKTYNVKIIRNDPSFRYVIGRYPDGHIPESKLFIQFDEKDHFVDKECKIYKQDDIDCTLQLASLGYIVFRISEKDWKENKNKVFNNFGMVII